MPTFLQLMMSNPSGFSQAGQVLSSTARQFNLTGQEFRAGMATATATWKGKTMNRASQVTRRFSEGVAGMGQHVSTAGGVASAAGPALQELVIQLRTGVQSAQGIGFLVFPVGQVFPGPAHYSEAAAAGPAAPAVLQAYMVMARMWSSYLQLLVQAATVEDQAFARQIQVATMELGAEIPFRSSLRAPAWFTRGGVNDNNRRRGEIAEELNEIWAGTHGHRDLGAQRPFLPGPGLAGHTNVDRLTRDPDRGLHLFEVKAGGGTTTPNQQNVLPRVRHGGPVVDFDGLPGMPRGSQLEPGAARATVQRWDVDAIPESGRRAIYDGHSVRDILNGRAGAGARQDMLDFMANPASRRTYTL